MVEVVSYDGKYPNLNLRPLVGRTRRFINKCLY